MANVCACLVRNEFDLVENNASPCALAETLESDLSETLFESQCAEDDNILVAFKVINTFLQFFCENAVRDSFRVS